MLDVRAVIASNLSDAKRALHYLDLTEGAGKAVVRHALESIYNRNRLLLEGLEGKPENDNG